MLWYSDRMSCERVSAVGTVTVRMSFERERVLWYSDRMSCERETRVLWVQ